MAIILDRSYNYQEKLSKATKAYQGFIFLMKKFLKIREKIFAITQLQYVEENIPKNTIINNNYLVYYHFFKELIDGVLLHHHIIDKPIKKYDELNNKVIFTNDNIIFNFSNNIGSRRNSVFSSQFKFKFNNNPLYEIHIKNENTNIQINNKKAISSILYLDTSNTNKIIKIISKRNKSYVMFEYIINNINMNNNNNNSNITMNNFNNTLQIIQSKKPKLIEFDKNANYGEIFLISYYK